jgi:flagellar protein FlaG
MLLNKERCIMYESTSATSIIDGRSQSVAQTFESKPVRAADEGSKDAERKPEKQDVSGEELEASVGELNTALKSLNVRREFTIEKEINEVVVKIIDSDNKSVIRQIPNEEAVKLSQNIKEMVGLLFDSTS